MKTKIDILNILTEEFRETFPDGSSLRWCKGHIVDIHVPDDYDWERFEGLLGDPPMAAVVLRAWHLGRYRGSCTCDVCEATMAVYHGTAH